MDSPLSLALQCKLVLRALETESAWLGKDFFIHYFQYVTPKPPQIVSFALYFIK